jgi:hypothetical protein
VTSATSASAWSAAASSLRVTRAVPGYAYELSYPSLGRTHLVLTPTERLARLSLLVAPPRYPFVRYGGLFAPAHGLREAIVARAPGPPREEGGYWARGACPARALQLSTPRASAT